MLISGDQALFVSFGCWICSLVKDVIPVKSLEERKQQLQALKPILKKRFKVETIDIFGSYARGEQDSQSDLDLLVTYLENEAVSLLTVERLRRYLRRKLHTKVDIVSKEFLNKYIKDEVLKEAVAV
jgi:uncharacterized protein